MSLTKRFELLVALSMLVAAGCAQRRGDRIAPGDNTEGTTCTSGDECRSGICVGGVCQSAQGCTEHGDCTGGQYCHFPSINPWVDGSQGECSAACTDDDSCGIIGQQCHAGRCYTNVDCTPANNSCDCPPGEVCSQQGRTCQWSPLTCYFNEQCPCGWVCNVDNSCIDPNVIGNTGCNNNNDCNAVAGCANNACECFDHACRVTAGCDPAGDVLAQCGQGNYCAGSVCRPATTCTGQDTCTPYGLVCVGNYCVNPDPCGANNTCPTGYTCATNLNPPGCLPGNTNECSRNEQCPAGEYCELLTGSCEPGCRDNHDCSGQCAPGQQPCMADTDCTSLVCDGADPATQTPGACSVCFCQADHSCDDSSVTSPNGSCTDNSSCAGGTACAPADKDDPLCAFGDIFGQFSPCSKECKQTCDLLVNQIVNTCSSGSCQAPGGWFAVIFSALLGQATGGASSSAGFCY